MSILHTARLRLEPFAPQHLDGLYRMNSDPEVQRFLSGVPETRDQVAAAIARVQARWAEFGHGWWSLVELDSAEVIGAGCIQHLEHKSENPLEIGWRLRRDCWGRGYASEAAQRMAQFAFEDIGVPLLYSVCQTGNRASERVMRRLGMQSAGIARHYEMEVMVYTLERERWRALTAPSARRKSAS